MKRAFSDREVIPGFTEKDFHIAAQKVRDAILLSLDVTEEEKHVFSQSFTERMRKLFSLDRRRAGWKRILQSAAILLVLVFLAGTLFLAFNPEARADFIYWIKDTYENSTIYRFFSDDSASMPEPGSYTEMPDFEFGWLPGEYEEHRPTAITNHRNIFLTGSSESDYIMLDCWRADRAGTITLFTNEHSYEDALINGKKADFYRNSSPGSENMLYWQDEDEYLVFVLSSPLDKGIMIKIAENIVRKNGTPDSFPPMPDVEFTWLPGEFESTLLTELPIQKCVILTSTSASVMLEYWRLGMSGAMQVFTDGFSHEEVTVNGTKADFYQSSSPDDGNVLIWIDEDAFLLFNMTSTLDKDVMIKIAENIVY